jgi:ADP-heptose:LPS heptosyltransferase
MKIEFMRKIDIFLGGFISQVLNLFSGILCKTSSFTSPNKKVKNILVIKFFGMGSIILMTPMLRSLRWMYPNAKIWLLTFSENLDICKQIDTIDYVLSIDPQSMSTFLRDNLKCLIKIWKNRPEITVDVEFFSNYTSLFSLLTFASSRVGFHLRQVSRGGHMTHKVSLNTHHHVTHVFYHLAAALGAKFEDENLNKLTLNFPSRNELLSAYEKLGFGEDQPIILVNPNASHLSFLRRWPANHFVSLVTQLAERYPEYTYVFVGVKKEFNYVQNIVDKVVCEFPEKFINAAGLLTINEFCGLLQKAQLLITNDSLPVHLASVYGANIVSFFGPESPKFYGTLSENSLCFFENIPCSPCLIAFDNKAEVRCKDNICLKQINPDVVFQKIEDKFFNIEPASIKSISH